MGPNHIDGVEPSHRRPLASTRWSIWREALLRSTGFPVSGLDLLADPESAAAADAYLSGSASRSEFDEAFSRSVACSAARINEIAANPRLREAIAWQSPDALVLLDSLVASDPAARNRRRRYRERQVARYWQRYCAKAETIGFFGPAAPATVDPGVADFSATPGERLLARRAVFLEPWALVAYGAHLAEDPAVRWWLPPAPMAHHVHDGRLLRRPGQPPVELTEAQAEALRLCDGCRPAALVATDLASRPALGLTGDQARRLLEDLAARKILKWDANVPLTPDTEVVLSDRIAAIGDEALRQRASDGLSRLRQARDAVASAAGDARAVVTALRGLAAEFTAVTGREPRRREGQMYAGRGLCYEDTVRDVSVTIGGRLLDGLAPALAVMLHVARWVTSEVGRAYEATLHKHVAELPGVHDGAVTLADVWYPAVELMWGRGHRPVDDVLDDLDARWLGLLGLSPDALTASRLEFSSARLTERLPVVFPADRPGWSLARIHSPDLLLCAESVDAINAGDVTAVLGELHIGHASLCANAANWFKPQPARMRRLAIQDYGRQRMVPLLPPYWSRDAGRLVYFEDEPSDAHLGFARAPYVDTRRLTPVGAITVQLDGDRLAGRMPDGQVVPLLEFFSPFLTIVVLNALRGLSAHPHVPRVTIDRLVVCRESWRMDVAELAGLAGSEADQYLAVRRLVADLGLPRRCFVKVSTETKPCYVDFASPPYVASFCAMVRAAARTPGPATVTVSEMMPTPEQAWLVDHEGERYLAELRMQVTDLAPAQTATDA